MRASVGQRVDRQQQPVAGPSNAPAPAMPAAAANEPAGHTVTVHALGPNGTHLMIGNNRVWIKKTFMPRGGVFDEDEEAFGPTPRGRAVRSPVDDEDGEAGFGWQTLGMPGFKNGTVKRRSGIPGGWASLTGRS